MDMNLLEKQISDALHHLEVEFNKIQAGRASTAMVEGLLVNVYGAEQPLRNVANLSTPDPGTILIQPWDKSVLSSLEKSIRERSDLGLNPNNDGNSVWIKIPQPTEERRKELVKVSHTRAEEARISIRNARHDHQKSIKTQLQDKALSEDQAKAFEKQLQEKVDEANKAIEASLKLKESQILTV